jgi:cyclophilin family peptidyl-prolyl cis-trans isomerase
MKLDRLTSLLFAVAVLACCTGSAALAADAKAKTEKPAKPEATASVSDAAIQAIDAQIAAAKIDKKVPGWKSQLPKPTVAKFVKGHRYLWHMVTNKGTMVFEFKPDVAPMHVTNFIYLTRLGFFDGLKFHRVIKGFMAQGGDPAGNGSGGPGYQYDGEVSPTVKHDKPGVLSTANAGPNTDGSQFFIMFKGYPSLDMKYSIFGELIEGLDTLSALQAAGNPGDGPPSEPLLITKVTVEVK